MIVVLYHAITEQGGGCRGRDRIAVGFTTTMYICNQCLYITTKIVSSNPAHGKVYSIQHYVIKFVSDFRQVCGFHLV